MAEIDISKELDAAYRKEINYDAIILDKQKEKFKTLLNFHFPSLDLSTIVFYADLNKDKNRYYCFINGCLFWSEEFHYYNITNLMVTYITKFWIFKIKTHYALQPPEFIKLHRFNNKELIEDLLNLDKIFKNPKRINVEYRND